MESHELLKELLKKTSAKQVCSDLGLSLSLIYKWAEPPSENAGSGAVNPLDRVEKLMRTTGDVRIAQWVAERAGGFFIHNPKGVSQTSELIPSTNAIVQQFADMLGVIATAAADQKITDDEARKIRAQWESLKSVTEGFVQAAEQGNFSGIRAELVEQPH
ncbi:phage regulatory CII family protein [Actomonas aquatica]|uniref:Phage regulatory CII family protein n=1 Tax=Actomonas aquatica TaxID=2866162 RepID=A0ABZ1C764_9BACT|nr:phage regulatory CII family protein [Opitutus sp. WL0086]WRQ87215.1 phage regulatory CII family protein [Opitutus sp. WL0086]